MSARSPAQDEAGRLTLWLLLRHGRTLLQGLERDEQPRPEAPVCRHHPLPGGRLTTIAGSGIVEHRVLTTYISTITEKLHIPQSYIPRRTPHDSLAGADQVAGLPAEVGQALWAC